MADLMPLYWVGATKDDLMELPDRVRKEIGYALYLAQIGMKAPSSKPLRGFGGAGVLEVVESSDGSDYRAVYTVQFQGAVFVLHVFQKKSRRGIQTPQADIEKIRARLRVAQQMYLLLRSHPP